MLLSMMQQLLQGATGSFLWLVYIHTFLITSILQISNSCTLYKSLVWCGMDKLAHDLNDMKGEFLLHCDRQSWNLTRLLIGTISAVWSCQNQNSSIFQVISRQEGAFRTTLTVSQWAELVMQNCWNIPSPLASHTQPEIADTKSSHGLITR